MARIGCFSLLTKLYGKVYISTEVYNEVVIDGNGLPGAGEVLQADWIEVTPVQNTEGLRRMVAKTGLGIGELSAVVLAKELSANLVLIDEWRARRHAHGEGLTIIGCVGILENLHEGGRLSDLRGAYQQLVHQKARIELQTLQRSLASFNLPLL
jgi:uncharacterized protein